MTVKLIVLNPYETALEVVIDRHSLHSLHRLYIALRALHALLFLLCPMIANLLGWADVKLRHAKKKITENTKYACALLSVHNDTHDTKGPN